VIERSGRHLAMFGAASLALILAVAAYGQDAETSPGGSASRPAAREVDLPGGGDLTNEPYAYEHELKQWGEPLADRLVYDAGYPIYPEALVIRPRDKAVLARCLNRLVPILQQVTADYAAHPSATNERISELINKMGAFPYTTEGRRLGGGQDARRGRPRQRRPHPGHGRRLRPGPGPDRDPGSRADPGRAEQARPRPAWRRRIWPPTSSSPPASDSTRPHRRADSGARVVGGPQASPHRAGRRLTT
jgi:hypothetical protein